MIRYFTAAFGLQYHRLVSGLLKSFSCFYPGASVDVFTDSLADFTFGNIKHSNLGDVLSELDVFYSSNKGQLHNVFKFVLFRRMRLKYPHDDLCWIDADMLVFDDLSKHLKPGFVNVMNHGRCGAQVINCGNGLLVDGDNYAIGGMYSLPSGAEELLIDLSRQRCEWLDLDKLVSGSGDQVILNHLVKRGGFPVNWITDNRDCIYNLEIADAVHPVVGDGLLGEIRFQGGVLFRESRRVAVFCWIKTDLDAHISSGFSTFDPSVRFLLCDFYDVAYS